MQNAFQQPAAGQTAALQGDAKPVECPLSPRWKRFSKRVAQLGFLFFLLKGIAWLAVGFLAWRGAT